MGICARGFEGKGLDDATECFWLTVVLPFGRRDILVGLYLEFFPVYHHVGIDPIIAINVEEAGQWGQTTPCQYNLEWKGTSGHGQLSVSHCNSVISPMVD